MLNIVNLWNEAMEQIVDAEDRLGGRSISL